MVLYRWSWYDMPVIWDNTTLPWRTQCGYWEERPCAVSEVILSERQQEQYYIEGISPQERTQKRTHVNKWVKEDNDEIREHWWSRCGTWERKAIHPYGSVDEVAMAVADRAERASNSATSARALSRELSVSWSTVRKILHCILRWNLYKNQIVQQPRPHNPQQRLDFALQFRARMEMV